MSPPPVPTGLQPLPLDGSAVVEAIEACRRAAGAIGDLADARARAAADARDEWRGTSRDVFDQAVAGLDAEAAHLMAELLGTAAALALAADDVRVENRRRVAASAAWVADESNR